MHMAKSNRSSGSEETYTYYGRGSKPLYHIQTPSGRTDTSSLLLPTRRLCIGQDNKQDTFQVNTTGPYISRDPSRLPSETAFRLLVPFLRSITPWKVTSKFLFNVCHILEDILVRFGFDSTDPSSHLLVPVLRVMRIWRLNEREEGDLERLAADLAGLVTLKLSCDSCKHAKRLECERTKFPIGSKAELQEKENIIPFRIPSHRKNRTLKVTKRRVFIPEPAHPPNHGSTSICHCSGCSACAVTVSSCQAHLRFQVDGAASHPKPPNMFLKSNNLHDEISLDSKQTTSITHSLPPSPILATEVND